MAGRSAWKGYLKLSLVSVPVKAYTATNSSDTIHLNQLHASCHQRIRYKKVCPEHGEVTGDEIVSGYEYAKDQYAVIDTGELEKLRPEGDKAISIDQFIDAEQLDARYQTGSGYFLLPDGAMGQQAYALIHDVMVESGLHAVAQVVLSNREQLVLIRPVENLLGMFVLRHADEVKQPESFADELVETKPSAQELKLTKMLMDQLREKQFDLTKYTDQYAARLRELIEAKVEGKELVSPVAAAEPRVINLMDALKASIERAQPSSASLSTARKAQSNPTGRAPSQTTRRRKTGDKATAKSSDKSSLKSTGKGSGTAPVVKKSRKSG